MWSIVLPVVMPLALFALALFALAWIPSATADKAQRAHFGELASTDHDRRGLRPLSVVRGWPGHAPGSGLGQPSFLARAWRFIRGLLLACAAMSVITVLIFIAATYRGPNRDGGATFKRLADASAIATERARP